MNPCRCNPALTKSQFEKNMAHQQKLIVKLVKKEYFMERNRWVQMHEWINDECINAGHQYLMITYVPPQYKSVWKKKNHSRFTFLSNGYKKRKSNDTSGLVLQRHRMFVKFIQLKWVSQFSTSPIFQQAEQTLSRHRAPRSLSAYADITIWMGGAALCDDSAGGSALARCDKIYRLDAIPALAVGWSGPQRHANYSAPARGFEVRTGGVLSKGCESREHESQESLTVPSETQEDDKPISFCKAEPADWRPSLVYQRLCI